MESYAMIQVSILLQPHRSVVANFVPGNFGLCRRNPWQPFAERQGSTEPPLKNTALMLWSSVSQTCSNRYPNQGSDYVSLPSKFFFTFQDKNFILQWSLIIQTNIVILLPRYPLPTEEMHISPGSNLPPVWETLL